MIEVDTLRDLEGRVGSTLGTSEWRSVDQPLIDRFADATGDHAWYHVDARRAANEIPGGRTIAHGLLTLSLVASLSGEIVRIRRHGRALVAGYDRVRFIHPVACGDRIRLRIDLAAAEHSHEGLTLVYACTMEIENVERPAMVGAMKIFVPD